MRRLVVVDDDKLFAELLCTVVESEPDLAVVGRASNAPDGLALVDQLEPDYVLMDVRLGSEDGIDATALLTARHPAVRVIILTGYTDPDLLERAAAARARAVHPKHAGLASLLWVLRNTEAEGFRVHPDVLRQLLDSPEAMETKACSEEAPGLTPRELEILQLLATGLDVRLISAQADISLHTCRGHVKSILAKLDAHSQLEAVTKALQRGLIRIESSS